MSKGKMKPFQASTVPAVEDKPDEFITSSGKHIPLQPVSRFLIDKRIASRMRPEPPTYSVETIGGGSEKHYHDATTVQTDEEKAAWGKYLLEKQEDEAHFNKDFFRMLILYGTKIEYPDDPLWELKQQAVGISIPTDPVARYQHYLESEFLVVEEDATDMMAKILELSGTSKEEADVIRSSFRVALQRARTGQLPIETNGLGSKPKVRRVRNSP